MTELGPIEQAVAVLRDGPILLTSRASTEARRERILPELRRLVKATPRRLQRRRLLTQGLIGTVTLVVAATLTVTWPEEKTAPTASTTSLLVEEAGVGSRRIVATGNLQAANDRGLKIHTDSGIEIHLTPTTEVAVSSLSQQHHPALGLAQGTVRCHVPKLPPESSFVVHTENTEVIVHGTTFSVTTRGPNAPACVAVEEGLVEVRHNTEIVMVGTGQSVGCDTPVAPPARQVTSTPTEVPKAKELVASRRSVPAEMAKTGSLEVEAQLLSRALVAERDGRKEDAYQLFVNLLRRYPNSVLKAEALAGVNRTRLR